MNTFHLHGQTQNRDDSCNGIILLQTAEQCYENNTLWVIVTKDIHKPTADMQRQKPTADMQRHLNAEAEAQGRHAASFRDTHTPAHATLY